MRIAAFILILLVLPCMLNAQQPAAVSFKDKEITIEKDGALFSNVLTITNASASTTTFHFELKGSDEVRMFNLPAGLVIAAGETKQVFVKFLLEKKTLKATGATIALMYRSKTDSGIVSFGIHTSVRRDLIVTIKPGTIYYDAKTNLLRCAVLVNNKGNTNEFARITTGYQSQWKMEQGEGPWLFREFTDTSLELLIKRKSGGAEMPEPLNLDLIDSFGNTMNGITIPIPALDFAMSLSRSSSSATDNYLSFVTGSIGNPGEFREYHVSYNSFLRDNGPVASVSATDFKYFGHIVFRNSYVGYKQNNLAGRLGTINISGELPLFGQGVQLKLGEEDRNLSATYLYNGNNYLLSESNGGNNATQNIHLSGAGKISANTGFHAMAMRQWNNPYYKDLYLGGIRFRTVMGQAEDVIEYGGYFNHAQTTSGSTPGFALFGRMSLVRKRWQLQSDNYYSDKGYAGLQKNTLQLDESITFAHKKNFTSCLRAEYLDSKPFVFDPQGNRIDNMVKTIDGSLIITKQWKKLSVNFGPSYNFQAFSFNKADPYQLSGVYGTAGLQYFSSHLHLDMQARAAIAQQYMGQNQTSGLPVRATFSMRYKIMQVQASWQQGSFFASDLMRPQENGKPLQIANVNPGFNLQLTKPMMNIVAGYSYQFSSGYDQHFATANVSITIAKRVQFMGNCIYSLSGASLYNDFRVGVRLYFGSHKNLFTSKRHFVFYEDANQNGLKDPEEQPLKGVVMNIGNKYMQSDAKGRMKILNYSNKFTPSIVNGNGYALLNELPAKPAKKNAIAMYKLGTVEGQLKVVKSKYSKKIVSITGLPIIFTSNSGQVYTCYVNDYGNFSIALPTGKYTIAVHSDLADRYTLDKRPEIEIATDQIVHYASDIYAKESQQVDVMKFSSKN